MSIPHPLPPRLPARRPAAQHVQVAACGRRAAPVLSPARRACPPGGDAVPRLPRPPAHLGAAGARPLAATARRRLPLRPVRFPLGPAGGARRAGDDLRQRGAQPAGGARRPPGGAAAHLPARLRAAAGGRRQRGGARTDA